MVKLKLHTTHELDVLVQYVELVATDMIEKHQDMDGAGIDAFYMNGKIELVQQLSRKLRIKQIDHKNKNTINLLDIQATILLEYNKYFQFEKFGQNVIMDYTSEVHKQLINH